MYFSQQKHNHKQDLIQLRNFQVEIVEQIVINLVKSLKRNKYNKYSIKKQIQVNLYFDKWVKQNKDNIYNKLINNNNLEMFLKLVMIHFNHLQQFHKLLDDIFY